MNYNGIESNVSSSKNSSITIGSKENRMVVEVRDESFHYSDGILHIFDYIKHIFLPNGYPHSVKYEYMEYQKFDTLQALCSYLRNVMCTQAVLSGAGVGSEKASAIAAAITWMMRDGFSMIGSILFASSFSLYFGEFVKEWRLYADVINDIGQILDMTTMYVPSNWYLPIISVSAICKASCGISAGATKLCITNHLCLAGNSADLNAKESTQETAVTLLGLVLGYHFANLFGNSDQLKNICFLLLTLLHVFCNYRAVSCLRLTRLNRPRLWLYTRQYITHCCHFHLGAAGGESTTHIDKSKGYKSDDLGVESVNKAESFRLTWQVVKCGPRLGARLGDVLGGGRPGGGPGTMSLEDWGEYCMHFEDKPYIVVPGAVGSGGESGLDVVLKTGCSQVL